MVRSAVVLGLGPGRGRDYWPAVRGAEGEEAAVAAQQPELGPIWAATSTRCRLGARL